MGAVRGARLPAGHAVLFFVEKAGYKSRMLLSTTLRLFLDGIGRREEYEFYLRKFHAEPGSCFAALMPDPSAVEQSAELMAFDLQFLLRLELTPLVLLCGPECAHMAGRLSRALPATVPVEAGPDGWPAAVEAALRRARAEEKIVALCGGTLDAGDVVRQLVPGVIRRLHVLRAQGGLRDTRGRPVAYHWLFGRNDHTLPPEEQPMLDLAGAMLEASPALHFAVASPLDLLREMFTVRGRGTVIRRGSVIRHARGLDGVDLPRLVALLTESFGRPLARPETLRQACDVYLEEHYRGAALLEAHEAGRYLSKFAVGTEARGEGMAQELWTAVISAHPALFWRSRLGNPINGWYEKQADGRHRDEKWMVFWRGIRAEHIPDVLAYCRARPADFEPASPGT
jgi:hypothetical protein